MEINRMRSYFSKKIAFLVFSMLLAGLILSGRSMVFAEETVGVKLAEKPEIGSYLTDATGMTLYRFANDETGISKCTGECLVKWPPFYVDPAATVEGVEASDLGTITRDDGSEQTTYKGMPLYYFFGDNNPGDTKGNGVKDVWFVVSP
jgi:predicted lipoprotein with Yx(FWY)xxD motif